MKIVFLKIIVASLDDIDEIRIKMLPHLSLFVKLLKTNEEKDKFLKEIIYKTLVKS